MNKLGIGILLITASASCFAQQWEVGGTGGAAFLPGSQHLQPPGLGNHGLQAGHHGRRLRESEPVSAHQRRDSLWISAKQSEAAERRHRSDVFRDCRTSCTTTWSCTPIKKDSRSQYFVAFGGGMRIFRGTGKEAAYQPLSQFAYLTKTQELKPMASVGAGIKYKLSPRVILRTEFRDYITPFPQTVIAPAPGAKFGSILHTFVPMVGIAYEY